LEQKSRREYTDGILQIYLFMTIGGSEPILVCISDFLIFQQFHNWRTTYTLSFTGPLGILLTATRCFPYNGKQVGLLKKTCWGEAVHSAAGAIPEKAISCQLSIL